MRTTRSTAWLLLVLAALALPGGCMDADSLGDEPPTVVAVGDPPTWANGVGELMQLKCGVCHVVPASDLSPRQTPQDFDLNHHIASPAGVPGAVAVIADIQGGILTTAELGERMPLEFATPLVQSEIDALEAWALNPQ